MDQLRNGSGHPDKTYRDLENEIKMLKDTISILEEDADKIFDDLKAENEKLKMKIEILLKCDHCHEKCTDKETFTNHILANHSDNIIKCNDCRKTCDENDYTKNFPIKYMIL